MQTQTHLHAPTRAHTQLSETVGNPGLDRCGSLTALEPLTHFQV